MYPAIFVYNLDFKIVKLLFLANQLVPPECYYIEETRMKMERESPNSQDLFPLNPIEMGQHLWSNAIYIITLLIR